jgi:hypothetical protein
MYSGKIAVPPGGGGLYHTGTVVMNVENYVKLQLK